MITIVHFERTYVTWKDQVRFVNQPNTINIENSKIGLPLELSSLELYPQEEIQSIIHN
jgi:hypothetical protein